MKKNKIQLFVYFLVAKEENIRAPPPRVPPRSTHPHPGYFCPDSFYLLDLLQMKQEQRGDPAHLTMVGCMSLPTR